MTKRMICIIACLLFMPSVMAQEMPDFENGSTICFVGNSITQDGRYHMLLQSYWATRHPERELKFIGCGIGGDTASDMIARFEDDVMRHKPDYAFLMTGMNDMSAALYQKDINIDDELLAKREATLQRYKKLTEQLINMMLERGIKPILMTPTIYDETAQLPSTSSVGKNAALLDCAAHIRAMGKKYNVPVVELTQFMLDINLKAQSNNAKYTIISSDRVHPKETGHFIMAHRIINTLWESEKTVSTNTIQAKRKSDITFVLKSKALPFPINKGYEEAQQHVPFIEEHNQEILKVEGLKNGQYILSIDEIAVDTLSNLELKKGINLATNRRTPQYNQAERIFALCVKYHQVHSKLRYIASGEHKLLKNYKGENTMASKRKYLDELNENNKSSPWYKNTLRITNAYYEYKPQEVQIEKELYDIRSQIYSENKPQEHKYQLKRIKGI